MAEKEIIIDLSGKIRFSKDIYISVGTFLLSFIIVVFQILTILVENNWQFDSSVFSVLLTFLFAIRHGEFCDEEEEKKIRNT